MTCTNFPKDNLVANETMWQVGNVTYLYKGGAPSAPLWEAITVPLKHNDISDLNAVGGHDAIYARTFANVDAMLAFNAHKLDNTYSVDGILFRVQNVPVLSIDDFIRTNREYQTEQSIESAVASSNPHTEITVLDLAASVPTVNIPAPTFKLTGAALAPENAGDTDGYTYFIHANGSRYERVREFSPNGSVMAYTENFSNTDLLHIAPRIGVCGFYLYLFNGDLSNDAAGLEAKKRLIRILDYYGFKIILGLSLPETGYQSLIDEYSDMYKLPNVVGIGAFDEPEFYPYQTLQWQSDVIDYIRTYTPSTIYAASVGYGNGLNQVSHKVDVVLLSYYAQNGDYPVPTPTAYENIAELDVLGRRKGRVKPIVGLYRDVNSNQASYDEIARHNQQLLSCFNNNGDVFAFVFYERDSFGLECLVYEDGNMRSLLADAVGFAKNSTKSTSKYAFFKDHGANPLIGISDTSTYLRKGDNSQYIGIDGDRYVDIDFDEEVYPQVMSLTAQDITGAASFTNTYTLNGFEGNTLIPLVSVSFTPNIDGNPVYRRVTSFTGRCYKKFRITFDAGDDTSWFDGGLAMIIDLNLVGNTRLFYPY